MRFEHSSSHIVDVLNDTSVRVVVPHIISSRIWFKYFFLFFIFGFEVISYDSSDVQLQQQFQKRINISGPLVFFSRKSHYERYYKYLITFMTCYVGLFSQGFML